MTSSSRRAVDDGQGRRYDVSTDAVAATDATDSMSSLRDAYIHRRDTGREFPGKNGRSGENRRGGDRFCMHFAPSSRRRGMHERRKARGAESVLM